MPKAPFARVVREITGNIGRGDMRIQASALEALQASEAYCYTRDQAAGCER